MKTTGDLDPQTWPGAVSPGDAGENPDTDARGTAVEIASTDHRMPTSSARVTRLEPGLYALDIGESSAAPTEFAGVSLPAIHIVAPPSDHFDPVEILGASGDNGSWLGPEGGTVVIRSPPGGGQVLVTAYGSPGMVLAAPEFDIRRLDLPPRRREIAEQSAAPPHDSHFRESRTREIRSEITLHIEGVGDRRFPGQGWVGNRGHKLRIEAFSIQPLEKLAAGDLEYKAFAPNGRETPWVGDGKLCGTRGRGLPLTGIAIRLAPHLGDRFDLVYQGAFFAGGVVGPNRNGEPCLSSLPDDPLEAINVRLVERIFD